MAMRTVQPRAPPRRAGILYIGNIEHTPRPATEKTCLPAYDLPMILLARLAVDRRFAGKGLGHALISEAFRITLRVEDEVGCRCIVTDTYGERADWFARYGFIPVEGAQKAGPQKMFWT